jgi:hypothetical protein
VLRLAAAPHHLAEVTAHSSVARLPDLGVAAGLGEADKALGALAVLGANVAMLVAAGTLTLVVQRRLAGGRGGARVRRTIR